MIVNFIVFLHNTKKKNILTNLADIKDPKHHDSVRN